MRDDDLILRLAPALAAIVLPSDTLRRELYALLAAESERCAHECLHRATALAMDSPERRALAEVGTYLTDCARRWRANDPPP